MSTEIRSSSWMVHMKTPKFGRLGEKILNLYILSSSNHKRQQRLFIYKLCILWFHTGVRSLCPSVDSNKPNSRSSKGQTVKHDLATVIKQLKGKTGNMYRMKPDISNDKKLGLHGFKGRFRVCCWDKTSSFRWMWNSCSAFLQWKDEFTPA